MLAPAEYIKNGWVGIGWGWEHRKGLVVSWWWDDKKTKEEVSLRG